MADLLTRMSKLVIGVSKLVIKEWTTSMIIGYMDISQLMTNADKIETKNR